MGILDFLENYWKMKILKIEFGNWNFERLFENGISENLISKIGILEKLFQRGKFQKIKFQKIEILKKIFFENGTLEYSNFGELFENKNLFWKIKL